MSSCTITPDHIKISMAVGVGSEGVSPLLRGGADSSLLNLTGLESQHHIICTSH